MARRLAKKHSNKSVNSVKKGKSGKMSKLKKMAKLKKNMRPNAQSSASSAAKIKSIKKLSLKKIKSKESSKKLSKKSLIHRLLKLSSKSSSKSHDNPDDIKVPALPMPIKARPKVGIFSITSCAGCQLSIIFMEDILLKVLSSLEVLNFPLVKEFDRQKHTAKDAGGIAYDIAIIEGCVTRSDEIDIVKDIRAKSKIVVAIGACACTGGIPSIADFIAPEKMKEHVYGNTVKRDFSSVKVSGIDKHIKVDYYLRGCPIDQDEFFALVTALALGKMPKEYDSPVCMECQQREIPCFLKQGVLCIGPITYGGCNALCTGNNIPCYGCRGPQSDADVDALLEIFQNMGYTKDDIRRMFIKFAGTSKKFTHIAEEYEKNESGKK